MRENFFHVAIDSVGPVELLVWKSREIWLFSAEADGGVSHLDKV